MDRGPTSNSPPLTTHLSKSSAGNRLWFTPLLAIWGIILAQTPARTQSEASGNTRPGIRQGGGVLSPPSHYPGSFCETPTQHQGKRNPSTYLLIGGHTQLVKLN